MERALGLAGFGGASKAVGSEGALDRVAERPGEASVEAGNFRREDQESDVDLVPTNKLQPSPTPWPSPSPTPSARPVPERSHSPILTTYVDLNKEAIAAPLSTFPIPSKSASCGSSTSPAAPSYKEVPLSLTEENLLALSHTQIVSFHHLKRTASVLSSLTSLESSELSSLPPSTPSVRAKFKILPFAVVIPHFRHGHRLKMAREQPEVPVAEASPYVSEVAGE